MNRTVLIISAILFILLVVITVIGASISGDIDAGEKNTGSGFTYGRVK